MKTSKIYFKYLLLSCIAAGSLLLPGCDDDDEDPKPAPGLTVEFTHLAGNKQFHLDSTYTTSNGDQFTPSMFKYYISNIRLVKSDNTEYAVPESYFLVNQEDEDSKMLVMENLAEGDFTKIRFMIGVDSTRNCSGAQTGALDPVNGMFWSWNTGYIFVKLEGTSPSIASPGEFRYHVGGFKGGNNNIKEIELDFNGETLVMEKGGHPEIHLVLDVLEIFDTPTQINMATFPASVMMPNADAQTLANNYADMIVFDHIHAEKSTVLL
jgi:hypothetical protein